MRYVELLEAVGPAWLYHGTSIENALDILHGNEILAYTEHEPEHLGQPGEYPVRGVSLTRDARFGLIHGGQVVFCLDEQALKARYKVIPLDWMHFHHGANNPYRRRESEEFVLTEYAIEPLERYLREIRVAKQVIDLAGEDASALLDHPLVRLYDARTLRPY